MNIEEQIELKSKIIEKLKDFDDDNDNNTLQKAMTYYCSMWDEREGMKHAITLTLNDQYNNHADEQDGYDLKKLSKILAIE